jgi:hypothetical protein
MNPTLKTKIDNLINTGAFSNEEAMILDVLLSKDIRNVVIGAMLTKYPNMTGKEVKDIFNTCGM